MKLKHSICCGLDVHKNVIVATIVITDKDGMFKGFTTGSSRIIVIMFVWNPQESIGFLFLIISKMTWMSAYFIIISVIVCKVNDNQKVYLFLLTEYCFPHT